MNLLVLPFSVMCFEGRAGSGGSSGCTAVLCTCQSSFIIKGMFSTTPKDMLRYFSGGRLPMLGSFHSVLGLCFVVPCRLSIGGMKRTCLAQQGLV